MHPLAFALAAMAAGGEERTLLFESPAIGPATAYLLEGWIRPSNREARLEAELSFPGGRPGSSLTTPPVRAGGGWIYTAAETGHPAPLEPGSARVFLAGGAVEAREVRIIPLSPRIVANGGFESPLDGKGRVPLWSDEKDGSLFPGKREGGHGLDTSAPPEGKASLAVSPAGDWHAVRSVDYPVPLWSDRFEISVLARSSPGIRPRIIAAWSDDGAARVLRADPDSAPSPADSPEWRRVSTGPLEPPAGARLLRAVLAAEKRSGEGRAGAAAWFDDLRINTLPPRARAAVVAVNQIGYDVRGPKSAVVMTNFFPAGTVGGDFEVVDAQGSSAVKIPLNCSGRVRGEKGADWGWYFWRADFSDLAAEGRYRARASVGGVEGVSPPFAVERDLLFRETAPPVVDFFFVQRCGFAVPGWHAACHLDDARLTDGAHADLAGGWHSAGDYNKITWEYGDSGAVYALARAAEAAPEFLARFDRDRDGVSDVLDEARWGAKYLSKLQTATGAFLKDVQQGPDRQSWMRWVPPEKQTDNVPGTPDDPVVLAGEGNAPLAAGGWARLSRLLGGHGLADDFAGRARRSWEWRRAGAPGRADPLLLLSTLELWRVTQDAAMRAFALESARQLLAGEAGKAAEPSGEGGPAPPPRLRGGYGDSGDIPAAALALFALEFPDEPFSGRIREALSAHLGRMAEEAAGPFGISRQRAGEEGWFFEPTSAYGQNFLFACRAWSALSIYRLLGDRRALAYAADHLDFILGKNPYGLCMFEGRGTFNPPRYHHRYDSIPGRERGAVPGAIPNGFVRDVGGHDRPGFDLSAGGRSHPSYRTSEPWLVHDVFFLLAVTELHQALR